MPLVEVTVTEGRDPARLRDLIHRVHNAVETSLGANPEQIRVIVREVPRSLWAAGDQTLAERDAAQAAARAEQAELAGQAELAERDAAPAVGPAGASAQSAEQGSEQEGR